MPKRLHCLRLADYGKDSIVASTAIFDNDPSIATRVVSVGVHTPSCTFIADFCIDLAHPIRVIGSTSHSRSLHAEFTVLEGQPRVACWSNPVVKRLFWIPVGDILLAHAGAGGAGRAELALRPGDTVEDGGAGTEVHRDVCLLMNAEPYPSWDEMLNRRLQSWRDDAARQARRPMFADVRPCGDCRREPYVVIAQLEDDPTAHRWPHWMQHPLWEHLIDVRGKLSEALALRVFARATIATYVDGAGLRPCHTWDQATRQAVQIVTEQAVLADLWLRYRMATLAPRPQRVRRAADGNHCPNGFAAGDMDRSEGASTIGKMDEDLLAAVAEPHCPSCDPVLHAHPRGWWCRGCDAEWRGGIIQYGE